MEDLTEDMAVGWQVPGFIDFNHFTFFLEHYHDFLVRLPLYLQRIESAEFEEGTEKSAHIGIYDNICLRTD